jgi:hypothetical protein
VTTNPSGALIFDPPRARLCENGKPRHEMQYADDFSAHRECCAPSKLVVTVTASPIFSLLIVAGQ